MPPRVAVVCPTRRIAALDPGGAAVHLRGIAEGFARAGAEVELWVARAARGGAMPAVDPPSTVRLREARRGRLPGVLRRRRAWDEAIDAASMARQARVWAREFRPDLVLERLALFASIGASLRRPGRPWVLEVDAPVAWEAVLFEGLPADPALLRWEARTLRSADRVLAVSQPLVDHAIHRGADPRRIERIPNGVREIRLSPSPSGRSPDRRESAPPFVLGYEGTFKPWQGTVAAVPALRAFGEALAPRRLVVELWGDGPDRAAFLRAAAGIEIDVRGWGRPDRTAWSAAWVPLAPWPPPGPRFAEPVPEPWFCPLKAAEAAAAGLPVLRGDRLDPPGPLPPLWEEIAARILARALGPG